MKKENIIIHLIIALITALSFTACDPSSEEKGEVTFGANYNVINCLVSVTVFIDEEKVGELGSPVASITSCGQVGNITKQLPVGDHTYKVNIYSKDTEGWCATPIETISGTFTVTANECTKVFLDFYEIFAIDRGCDYNVFIDPQAYETDPDHPFTLTDMSIDGDCLKIKISASGCSGETWIVKLIDSGVVAESNPCQMYLRISLENYEACEAWITKEYSFNIKSLQIAGDNRVQLHVSGETIIYEY